MSLFPKKVEYPFKYFVWALALTLLVLSHLFNAQWLELLLMVLFTDNLFPFP